MTSPYLLYHCWKDAKRETKNSPNSNDGGGCVGIFIIAIVVIFGGKLIFSGSLEMALVGLAIFAGLVKGFAEMKDPGW
jgi:TRAP-type mannitol/chloroaromatic compound transport system permease small subunit